MRPISGARHAHRCCALPSLVLAQLADQAHNITTAVEAVDRDTREHHAVIEAFTLAQADGQADPIRARDFTAIGQAGLFDHLSHFQQ